MVLEYTEDRYLSTNEMVLECMELECMVLECIVLECIGVSQMNWKRTAGIFWQLSQDRIWWIV